MKQIARGVKAMGEIMATVRETRLLYASACNRVSNELNVEGGVKREANWRRREEQNLCPQCIRDCVANPNNATLTNTTISGRAR